MKIKKDYQFDPESYVNDISTPLLCVNCNALCFHCGKKHIMANQVVVLLCLKYKAKGCYSSLKTKKGSCIDAPGNSKQGSVCKSCFKNDNDVTTTPPINHPTDLTLPSQSSPIDPTDVLRLSRLSDTTMSEFYKNVTTLVHTFDMESPMENFNSVSKGQYLK